jgi:hypothetical protein
MKKFLLIASLAVAGFAKSQSSFLLTDPNTQQKAAYNYTFWVGMSDPTVTLEFPVTNTSGAALKSRIRKTNITNASGQDVYFCYASTCYTPNTFITPGAPIIQAGQTFPTGSGTYGLRTDFDANGVLGQSIVRYTVYDSLNHSDSVNVTITYNVTANGIKTNAASIFVSNASPNPASNMVNFSYDLNGSGNASVRIYNSLGNLVKTATLSAGSKSAQVDVSALEEGFYFYSVIADGKAITTRRLVITR